MADSSWTSLPKARKPLTLEQLEGRDAPAIMSLGDLNSYPFNMTDVNGTLFFVVNDGLHGEELWKSDGTAAGTVLVKDIQSGSLSSFPKNLMNLNGTLYFTADDGVHGSELWKSDGTASGTVLVKDITNGSIGSVYHTLTNVSGTLFFAASDGVHDFELWKSDGTADGTMMVKDIRIGNSSYPQNLVNVDGTLYFSTRYDWDYGAELWKSDGTTDGTMMVKDIRIGGLGSFPDCLTNVNGILFFTADDGSGRELWKSNGTASGTVMVKDINQAGGIYPNELIDVNGTLFFAASNGIDPVVLWKSDGTQSGTVIVKDSLNVTAGIYPENLINLNGVLYYYASDQIHGRELWKSDGTVLGTVLLKDLFTGTASGTTSYTPTKLGNQLFFIATNGFDDWKLWRSDGTSNGTIQVNDQVSPFELTPVGDKLFFSGMISGQGEELWMWQNEAPTNIAISSESIPRNAAPNLAIGNFSTTDPDVGDTFTYTLVSGTGSTDNSRFAIDGNTLKTALNYSFNNETSYSIRVRSTDQNGAFTEKQFTIVVDVPVAPFIETTPTTMLPIVLRNSTTHTGVTVASLLANATDPETASGVGMAVMVSFSDKGVWQYRSAVTDPWVNVPPTSFDSVFLLPRTDLIRFLPNRNVTGYANLRFLAWDGVTGTPRTNVNPINNMIAFSFQTELAWVPVGITTPKYNSAGNIPLIATKEDVTSSGTIARNLLGFLPTEFPVRTNLGLAITGTTGNGTWQVLVGRTWQPIGAVSETAARLLKPTDQIRFVPSANWNGEAMIHYRAWKVPTTLPLPTVGDTTNSSDFSREPLAASLTVTPVNDAPTIDRSIARVFDANPKSVADLMQGTADIDSTIKGIALTRIANKNGFWEYRKTTADSWLKIPAVSARSGLLLDASAEIRFTPNVGTLVTNASFDYKAWDNSLPYNSGDRKATTTTAFSILAETATFSIGNTAPTFKPGTAPVLPATTTLIKPVSYLVSTLLGRMTDTPGFLRGIAVTNTTGSGTWDFSVDGGKTWQAIGDVSTNRLLLRSTDRLRFTPTPNTLSTATISFAAWDQTTGAFGDRISGTNDSMSTEILTATMSVF